MRKKPIKLDDLLKQLKQARNEVGGNVSVIYESYSGWVFFVTECGVEELFYNGVPHSRVEKSLAKHLTNVNLSTEKCVTLIGMSSDGNLADSNEYRDVRRVRHAKRKMQ